MDDRQWQLSGFELSSSLGYYQATTAPIRYDSDGFLDGLDHVLFNERDNAMQIRMEELLLLQLIA